MTKRLHEMTSTLATPNAGELAATAQTAVDHDHEYMVPDTVPERVVCRGVTKDFGLGATRVQALRGVDLEIHCGEVTLLVGPSGCGKTTLISVIAGLLDPTAGDVEVLGDNLTRMSAGRRTRYRGRNIGFAFQQYNLLPALTARENAAIPLMANGWGRGRALAKATELIEAVGLAPRADALPSQLSGGEQQRVAIARALVHEPRLLLCDEPTSSLDGQTGHAVMELVREVAVRPDRVVLVVTHDNRIFPLGDRIVHMLDGTIQKIETGGNTHGSQGPGARHKS